MITKEQLLRATDSLMVVGSDPEKVLGEREIDPHLIFHLANDYHQYSSEHYPGHSKQLNITAAFMMGFMIAVEVLLGEKDA